MAATKTEQSRRFNYGILSYFSQIWWLSPFLPHKAQTHADALAELAGTYSPTSPWATRKADDAAAEADRLTDEALEESLLEIESALEDYRFERTKAAAAEVLTQGTALARAVADVAIAWASHTAALVVSAVETTMAEQGIGWWLELPEVPKPAEYGELIDAVTLTDFARRVPVIDGEHGFVCHCLRTGGKTLNSGVALLARKLFDQGNLQAVRAFPDGIASPWQAVAHPL